MRRDYFALDVRTPAGPADSLARPTIVVTYDGPAAELCDQLTDDAGEPLPAEAVDVACRLQAEDPERCVLGLTHRITGEFLLEVNGETTAIGDLVEAARSADDETASYRVRIEPEDGEDLVYDKETLLVYDEEGSLLRQHSLIPSGVEL